MRRTDRFETVRSPQVAKPSMEEGQATTELAIALPLLIGFLLGVWLIASLLYKESVFAHAAMAGARIGVSASVADVESYLSRAMRETLGQPATVSVRYASASSPVQDNHYVVPAELEAMFDRATWVESRYSPGGFSLPFIGRWQPSFHQRLLIDRSDYEAGSTSGKMVMDRTYAIIIAGLLAGHETANVDR